MQQKILDWAKSIEENNVFSPFALYYSHDSPRGGKMFVMENPGSGGLIEKYSKELKAENEAYKAWARDLAKNGKASYALLEEFIKCSRECAKSWLIKGNAHLLEFFKILSENDIIKTKVTDKKSYDKYIENDFFQDFWVTDWCKTRFKTDLEDIIRKEIEWVQPRLVFLFSGYTWQNFYKIYEDKLKPQIQKQFSEDEIYNDKRKFKPGIEKMHGHFFTLQIPHEVGVFPLIHFVGQAYKKHNAIYYPRIRTLFSAHKEEIQALLSQSMKIKKNL